MSALLHFGPKIHVLALSLASIGLLSQSFASQSARPPVQSQAVEASGPARIGGTIVRGGTPGGGQAPGGGPSSAPVPRNGHTFSAYSSRNKYRGLAQDASGGTPGITTHGLTVSYNGFPVPLQAVGGQFEMIPAPGHENWFNLKLFVPSTGLEELFILGIPDTAPTQDAPMLVGFHASNASHGDLLVNTTFWEECKLRGWYFLSPLSRSPLPSDPDISFSNLISQDNARAAMEWVVDRYPIDSDRIYAVGFSGGGGIATSIATRYLDPREPMFAALVDHTGTVDIADSYAVSGASGGTIFDILFGGSPTQVPFQYRRVSPIELDANHFWVPGGDHMATNLSYLSTDIWYANGDPIAHLVQQNQQLFDWMNGNGGGPVSLNPIAGSQHTWDLLNETSVCNWFAGKSLQLPLAGNLLMDRPARYLFFDLQQAAGNSFSRLTYNANPGANQLSMTGMENVLRMDIDTLGLGLSTASGQTLQLTVASVDTGGDLLRIMDVPSAPTSVLRNGVTATGWTYQSANNRLDLFEPNAGQQTWTITF